MDYQALSPTLKVLLGFACFVVVVAGMKAASEILVPFLLSAFIAILCAPLVMWLESRRIPTSLAVIAVVLLVVLTIGGFSMLVATSINDFARQIPAYQASLREETTAVTQWLAGHGIELSQKMAKEQINPGKVMEMVRTVVTGFGNVLTDFFLIFLTVLFILFEVSSFPAKFRRAMGDQHRSLTAFEQFNQSVKGYLIIKTLVSLGTGLFIGVWLGVQGVDYVVLWALLAFLLNFIPNIGSIIAAVPAVLLSFVQLGLGAAGISALGFLIVNVVMGNIVEPRYMGQGLGLSTLVVFLSLLFWGWVLGPVGMLLSIPLTMIVKLALESNEESHWLAVLLGNK
ncbi:AI-2E family transporter [Ketobacter sp.]|uniref:AI-2E family transporter n=1 Tax=Ketobacter sp. TaxID=2083498 RepID=UPI000F10DF58|nr:AI-2E family transporter [Ketobacter sp.]RLT92142.1 MAG: AI-2E family transporter [Ketobacter sp.]